MQGLQSLSHLYQAVPYITFLEQRLQFLVVHNLVVKIAIICEIHHDAKCARTLIEESLFVSDDVFVSKSC